MDSTSLFSIPLVDPIFIMAALSFNLLVIGIYISDKLKKTDTVRRLGIALLSLTVPFFFVFIAYVISGKPMWIYLVFFAIFIYMFLEWLWDYRLKIDFRADPKLHIPYIILFYIVLFGNIAVTFTINRVWGWILSISLWLLLAALIFSLIPDRKPKND